MKTIRAHVSQAILPELTRFFGGFDATLAEILQNCYRAGAKNVTVITDPECTVLTILDDGRGCEDPQLLVEGGETGWDRTKVTSPAGMGFFSLLNPDLFTEVTVRSKNWKVKFDTKNWIDKDIQPIEEEGVPGFYLKLILSTSKKKELDHAISTARALYPFTLTLNGNLITQRMDGDLLVDLMTPVGRVLLGLRSSPYFINHPEPVWDYRYLRSGKADEYLKEAKTLPIDEELKNFIWFVDPESGVRPKLPDRSILIDSPQLKSAMQQILTALRDYVLHYFKSRWSAYVARLRPVMTTLPELFTHNERKDMTELDQWLNRHRVALVRSLGWRHYSSQDYENCSFDYVQDEGIKSREEEMDLYVQGGQSVVDDGLINTLLNWEEFLDTTEEFYAGPQHPIMRNFLDTKKAQELVDIQVTEPSGKPAPGNSVYLLAASSITWNGHRLPFYLGAREEEPDSAAFINGTPMDLIVHLKEEGPVFHYLIWYDLIDQGDRHSWFEDDCVLTGKAYTDLSEETATLYDLHNVIKIRNLVVKAQKFNKKLHAAHEKLRRYDGKKGKDVYIDCPVAGGARHFTLIHQQMRNLLKISNEQLAKLQDQEDKLLGIKKAKAPEKALASS